MERVIILKNTVTGQELTMPVTPASYPVANGRAVERLDMAQTGQIAIPGLKTLFSEPLEVMLPAQQYPFCTAGAVADPGYYLDLLTAWSAAGNVCRYIVAGAGVNYPVLLGPIEWLEKDGTNDVYAKIPLYEYRYLAEVTVETTQNGSRPPEGSGPTATSYVVQQGDSLWSICKKLYGDSSLAYRLAAANGISNPNLIYPGQVLIIPDVAALPAAAPLPDTGGGESTAYARMAARDTIGLSPVTLQVTLT